MDASEAPFLVFRSRPLDSRFRGNDGIRPKAGFQTASKELSENPFRIALRVC